MKGTKHFIIHVPELHNEELKTKSGVKLFADKRFSSKQTTNTIFEVVETPLNYTGPIKKGWWLMVDQTMVFEQTYEKGGTQENEYLLNREKRHYKIEPSLILCFRESKTDKWRGFQDNVICEPVSQERKDFEKVGKIFMPNTEKPKSVKGQMKIVIGNESLSELGVKEGDTVFVSNKLMVAINVEGVNYQWLRVRDILAKNNAA